MARNRATEETLRGFQSHSKNFRLYPNTVGIISTVFSQMATYSDCTFQRPPPCYVELELGEGRDGGSHSYAKAGLKQTMSSDVVLKFNTNFAVF